MKEFGLCGRIAPLVLLLVSAAAGDVVTTSDGSRFVGTVEKIANGRLVIHTEIAGRLEIDASKVTGISTESSVSVVFRSGDTLVGRIVESPDRDVSVVRSGLGDIRISPSDITLLWPAGTENPELVAVREEAQAEIQAAQPKWTTTLEGGVTRTEGNTDTLQGRGRFDAKRVTPNEILHFYVAGKYAEQNDARTTNEYYGGIRFESLVSDRKYWYARTELEFDEFEDIDLRATAAVGRGYYWLKEPDRELKTSIGLGYRHEAYDGGRTENDAVIDLSLDYRRDISPWVQFTHSAIFNPDFEDFDNYRLALDTALLIPFKNDRMTWKIGVRNEYNSRPQPGFERLDNTYYTSIVLKLE